MLATAMVKHKRERPEKTELLTVRMSYDTYVDLSAAVALKGATLSSLVHQYAFKVIREERDRNPAEFARAAVRAREDLAETKAKKAAQRAARVGLIQVIPDPEVGIAVPIISPSSDGDNDRD